ncbi:conserved hypothetical protein [uncultured Desulfovibrio sp.]|uniref:Uncharacterized protein n=1 Tax=uncultured Desulfovibrio sp. TaxID=167968 RepID=A0A212L8C2_9BACT|nr:conserved hypothetical protein [uncultured Desulfovibrio sp.]VZH34442.1 conserved protein of unknown function [Desulfovibrio sp. 86]
MCRMTWACPTFRWKPTTPKPTPNSSRCASKPFWKCCRPQNSFSMKDSVGEGPFCKRVSSPTPPPPKTLGQCRHERLSSYFCVELRLLFLSGTIRVHSLHKGLFSLI